MLFNEDEKRRKIVCKFCFILPSKNIIFQKEVTVLISDTPEVVAAKIHELEQDHFPAVIEKLLTNR